MRHLKEFKALISEKTVPKSIRILGRTVIILGIIIIVLTAIELSYKVIFFIKIGEKFSNKLEKYFPKENWKKKFPTNFQQISNKLERNYPIC